MKNSNKKGFTIIELVIVIAVIAILAAVLIPTFASLIKKANMSADQQAVRQMNTILAAEGAVEKNTIFDVYDVLAANGFEAEDYKPLTKNTAFVWDASIDRILHVSADYTTIYYPEEYTDMSAEDRNDWNNLVNVLPEGEKPEGFEKDDTEVTVTSAAEYVYVVKEFNQNKTTKETLTIDLGGNVIDMHGTSVTLANSTKGYLTKDVVLKNGTFKNVNAVDAAYISTKNQAGNDGVYVASTLFGVLSGASVTIEDVVIENANIKNTHVSNASFLIANAMNGTAVIKDVTIKDSTIIAHRNAGALVGLATNKGSVTLGGDIVLDNVQVKTVGGRSGLLVGYMNPDKIEMEDDLSITLKNDSAYSIYECEQNTGTFDGHELGWDEDTNILWSYAYSSTGNQLEDKKFFADAYATAVGATEKQIKYNGFDDVVRKE